jgi:hypothetical protein
MTFPTLTDDIEFLARWLADYDERFGRDPNQALVYLTRLGIREERNKNPGAWEPMDEDLRRALQRAKVDV